LTAVLTAFTHWLGQSMPAPVWTAYLLELAATLFVVTLLFALIFKLLPAVTVSWKDVWIGAVVTAVLFMIGKFLIGLYIGGAGIGSIYGAGGSLVVLLVWTYYSSQILFFGAELIRAHAKHFGAYAIVPGVRAGSITELNRVEQGVRGSMDR
jgi:membrane protein